MEDTRLDINYDVFNKEAYQKVLDTLENPAARFYITADDVLHGHSAGDDGQLTQSYEEASDVLANWKESVHVAADGKIPEGTVEAEPDELAAILTEAINEEKPFRYAMEGHGPSFVYENEQDVDRVNAVLDVHNERHLNDNRIPFFDSRFSPANPVVAYFRDKYDIDFSDVVPSNPGAEHVDNDNAALGPAPFGELCDALSYEFKDLSKDVFEQKGYGEAWEYVYGNENHPEGIEEWALQTAQSLDDYKSIEDLHDEIKKLAAQDLKNIDTDEIYIPGVYGQRLDDLKVGHEVAYYIDDDSVQHEVNLRAEYGEKAPDAGDVIEDWSDTVKTAMNGKVPEGAVEVVLDSPVSQYLDQEYKAEDLPAAMDLAWAITTEKPMSEVSKEDSPLPAFCFASDKEYDRCQAMIDRAIGRNGPEVPGR